LIACRVASNEKHYLIHEIHENHEQNQKAVNGYAECTEGLINIMVVQLLHWMAPPEK